MSGAVAVNESSSASWYPLLSELNLPILFNDTVSENKWCALYIHNELKLACLRIID